MSSKLRQLPLHANKGKLANSTWMQPPNECVSHMFETPIKDTEESLYSWSIHITEFGQFLVWTAAAAEWLRREHRIVGHASIAVGTQSSRRYGCSSSATNSQLPVHISLEECSLLLSYGFVLGLTRSHSIKRSRSPTMEQLSQFEDALEKNATEMQTLVNRKHRLELTGLYGDLLRGVPVRARRQFLKQSKSSTECSQMLSIRARRKAARRIHHPRTDETLNDNEELIEACSSTSNDSFQLSHIVSSCVGVSTPTVDHLINYFNEGRDISNSIIDQEACNTDTLIKSRALDYEDVITRHLPRPTPQEWIREGEVERIPLPVMTRKKGIFAIVTWLAEQRQLSHVSETREVEQPASNIQLPSIERLSLLACVFADLWSQGYYLTPCCTKMGGDYLLYQGDPLLYHASHIVLVVGPRESVHLERLFARLRCAHSVCKQLVLASVEESILASGDFVISQSDISSHMQYTTLQWTRPNLYPMNCAVR